MNNNVKVRQLPKKTFLYIAILVIAGILAVFIVKDGKAQKATKILTQLGFTKVSNVSVFSKTEFLNEGTNVKGYQYSLKFIDLTTQKECRGFILKDFKGKIAKDLECK
ncbi:MAG: hypothetical protein KAQ94_09445 [Arcobacteraceae bacterium]|nr:hypothetical protein [Arcobacteraceae bacterium]